MSELFPPHPEDISTHPVETLVWGIEQLDLCVEHSDAEIPGVIRWFETDLDADYANDVFGKPDEVVPSAIGTRIMVPCHARFELLETEGINQRVWRFRIDHENSGSVIYQWGIVAPDLSQHRLRLTDFAADPELPPLSQFHNVSKMQAWHIAEAIAVDLLAYNVTSIATGVQWLEDDPDFKDILEEFAHEKLTVPGISENGQLLPDVYSFLMSAIEKNTDLE